MELRRAPQGVARRRRPHRFGELADEGTFRRHRRRFYLADADFLAAVTGPAPLVQACAAALDEPQGLLYLGRRNCTPTGPLNAGVHTGATPLEVLDTVPRGERAEEGDLTVWIDGTAMDPDARAVPDQPVAFGVPASYALRYECPVRVSPPWGSGREQAPPPPPPLAAPTAFPDLFVPPRKDR